MKRAMISFVALAVAALVAAPGSAQVLFTGDGDPTAAGLENINTANEWSFDTPSPGFLQQGPGNDDGGYGLDDIDNGAPDIAAAELDPNNGYFFEVRMDVESSTDGAQWPGFNIGVVIFLEDSSGRNLVIHPNDPNSGTVYGYFSGNWGDANTGAHEMGGGFHTLRVEHPGGGADTVDIFYDGGLVADNFTMSAGSASNGQARLFFGNSGALSSGQAVYDYIGINQEIPEPASMALLGMGAMCLLRRRR